MPPLTVQSHRVLAGEPSFQPSRFAYVAAFVLGASAALIAVSLALYSLRGAL